jgi:hypothetical protein
MASLTYRSPDGARIENPGEEFLRDLVLHAPASTWKRGSGDSGLHRADAAEALMFFAVEPFGVYVAFILPDNAEVVTTRSADRRAAVKHHVGGEPFVRPRACFLPRELAWE